MTEHLPTDGHTCLPTGKWLPGEGVWCVTPYWVELEDENRIHTVVLKPWLNNKLFVTLVYLEMLKKSDTSQRDAVNVWQLSFSF